ncbi:hypothetical protein V1522DRAFT_423851 [Lipomyces starkeyi]
MTEKRKLQNRLAQRTYREKRKTYLAELQRSAPLNNKTRNDSYNKTFPPSDLGKSADFGEPVDTNHIGLGRPDTVCGQSVANTFEAVSDDNISFEPSHFEPFYALINHIIDSSVLTTNGDEMSSALFPIPEDVPEFQRRLPNVSRIDYLTPVASSISSSIYDGLNLSPVDRNAVHTPALVRSSRGEDGEAWEQTKWWREFRGRR